MARRFLSYAFVCLIFFIALPNKHVSAQLGTIDTLYYGCAGLDNVVMGGLVQPDSSIIIYGNFTRSSERLINGIAKLSQDGTNDYNFSPGTGTNGQVNVVLRQSNGKLIVGGQFTRYNGTTVSYVVRTNTDGSLDTSFHGSSALNSGVNGGYIQGDGKIILIGGFTGFSGTTVNAIVRLNTDGTIDNTFTASPAQNTTSINVIAVQADGKFIIAGNFTKHNGTSENCIARLNTNGTVDTSFSVTGPPASSSIYGVSVLPSGKLIVAGSFSTWNGTTVNGIVRLNSNGSIDGTFSPGTGFGALVYSMYTQPDSKMVLAGRFTTYSGSTVNYLVRIDTTGTRDTTFHATGLNLYGYSVFGNYDGKLFVGGTYSKANSYSRICLSRFNGDGTLDQSFLYQSRLNGTILATGFQSSGKAIVAGTFSYYNDISVNNIARFNTDGSLDTTFHLGTGTNNTIRSVYILPNDKILIGGDFTTYNGTSTSYITRLNSDGTLDNAFVTTGQPNNSVYTLISTNAGKIYMGGSFVSAGGSTHNRLARLNSDGSIDNTYTPNVQGGTLVKLQFQGPTKIIAAGGFTSINGTTYNRIFRIDTLGAVDTSFHLGTGANNSIQSMDIQVDSKILIVGTFTTYNGASKSGIARLKSDGSLDSSFTSTGGSNMNAIAANNNGAIVGGNFTTFNGTARNGIAYLDSTGALDASFTVGTGVTNIGAAGNVGTVNHLNVDPNTRRTIVSGSFTSMQGNLVASFAGLRGSFSDVAIDNVSSNTPACTNGTPKVFFYIEHKFNNGNTFTVQLSDSSGSFASPTAIGTQSNANNNGWDSIIVTIPGTALTSSHYKVRIVGTNPIYTSPSSDYFRIGPMADTITPSGAVSFCQGDSAVLTSNAHQNYLWSTGSSVQNITVDTAGSYSVTVTSNNCSATATKIVTVNPRPNDLPLTASPITVCPGNSSAIKFSGSQVGVEYSLFCMDSVKDVQMASYTTLALITGGVDSLSKFWVYALDTATSCSRKFSDTAIVTITPEVDTPVFISGAQQLCLYKNECYLATAENSSKVIYSIDSGAASIDSMSGCLSSAFTNFIVRATAIGLNGCSTAYATLSVIVAQVYPPIASDTQEICGSAFAVFRFDNIESGLGGNEIAWSMDSSFAQYSYTSSPAGFSFYTIAPFSGTLWLASLDSVTGCKSEGVPVWLDAKIAPFGAIEPTDTAVLLGQQVTLTASGGDQYYWALSGDTTAVIVDTPVAGFTSYEVIISDSNGCSKTYVANVNGVEMPWINIVNYHDTIYSGETTNIVIERNLPGITVSWFRNDTTYVSGADMGTGPLVYIPLVNNTDTGQNVTFTAFGDYNGDPTNTDQTNQNVRRSSQSAPQDELTITVACPEDALIPCSEGTYHVTVVNNAAAVSCQIKIHFTMDGANAGDITSIIDGFTITSGGSHVSIDSREETPGDIILNVSFDSPDPVEFEYKITIPCSATPTNCPLGCQSTLFQTFESTGLDGSCTMSFPDHTNTIGCPVNFPYVVTNSTAVHADIHEGTNGQITLTFYNTGNTAYVGDLDLYLSSSLTGCSLDYLTNCTIACTGISPITVPQSGSMFHFTDVNIPPIPHGANPDNTGIFTLTINAYVPDCHADVCKSGTLALHWGCSDLCEEIPIGFNITVLNPLTTALTISRLAPSSLPNGAGYNEAWDATCINAPLHWEFLIDNTSTTQTASVSLRLYYDLAERMYTVIAKNTVQIKGVNNLENNTLLRTGATYTYDVSIPGASFADPDYPATCQSGNTFSHVTSPTLTMLPGTRYVLEFDSYDCCAEDNPFGSAVWFDHWQLQGRFANDCDSRSFSEIVPANTSGFNPYVAPLGSFAISPYFKFDQSPNLLLQQQLLDPHPTSLKGTRDGDGCSPITPVRILNTNFPSNITANWDAQLFSVNREGNGNAAANGHQVRGQFKFEIVCGADIQIVDAASLPAATIQNNGITWSVISTNPMPQNTHDQWQYNTADFIFDMATLPSTINDLASHFRDFFTNSTFNFNLKLCCPLVGGNNAEDVWVRTYFMPADGDKCDNSPICWIPLREIHWQITPYCPNCITPGIHVTEMHITRNNYGYQDDDNDGRPNESGDRLIPIDNTYIASNEVNVQNCIVGDGLDVTTDGYFEDGVQQNLGFTWYQWHHDWFPTTGFLHFISIERQIKKSDFTNLQITSASIDYFANGNNTSTPTQARAFPNTLLNPLPAIDDDPNTQNNPDGGRTLFEMSDDFLNDGTEGNGAGSISFGPGDRFILHVTYDVCGNPSDEQLGSANNIDLAMQDYMYLSVDGRTSPTAYPYLDNNSNWTAGNLYHNNSEDVDPSLVHPLFYCESGNDDAYQYQVKTQYSEDYTNTTQHYCGHSVKITAGYYINDPSGNDAFKNEYRLLPGITTVDGQSYLNMAAFPSFTISLATQGLYPLPVSSTTEFNIPPGGTGNQTVDVTVLSGNISNSGSPYSTTVKYYPPYEDLNGLVNNQADQNPTEWGSSTPVLIVGDGMFQQTMSFDMGMPCAKLDGENITVGKDDVSATLPAFATCNPDPVSLTLDDGLTHTITPLPVQPAPGLFANCGNPGAILLPPNRIEFDFNFFTWSAPQTYDGVVFYWADASVPSCLDDIQDISYEDYNHQLHHLDIHQNNGYTYVVFPYTAGSNFSKLKIVYAFQGCECFFPMSLPVQYFWTCDGVSLTDFVPPTPCSTVECPNPFPSGCNGCGKSKAAHSIFPDPGNDNIITSATINDASPYPCGSNISMTACLSLLSGPPLNDITAAIRIPGLTTAQMDQLRLSIAQIQVGQNNLSRQNGDFTVSVSGNVITIDLTAWTHQQHPLEMLHGSVCITFELPTSACENHSDTVCVSFYGKTYCGADIGSDADGGIHCSFGSVNTNCRYTPHLNIITITPATCPNNPAFVWAKVSPGLATPGYNYQWSTGGTIVPLTEVLPGRFYLAPGNYNLTVTGLNGCELMASITIDAPAGLTVSADVTTEPTCGQSDGVITSSASGGTPSYNYLWNSSATTATLSGAGSGNYTVTATDANGCSGSASASLSSSGSFDLSVTYTNESCPGSGDGTASVTPSISGEFTYLWSNGSTTSSVTGLVPGIYGVTVTDGSCSATGSVTIEGAESNMNINAVECNTPGSPDYMITAFSVYNPCEASTDNVYTYTWSINNPDNNLYYIYNSSSNEIVPLVPGTYEISVIVNDGTNSVTLTNSIDVPNYNVTPQTLELTVGDIDYNLSDVVNAQYQYNGVGTIYYPYTNLITPDGGSGGFPAIEETKVHFEGVMTIDALNPITVTNPAYFNGNPTFGEILGYPEQDFLAVVDSRLTFGPGAEIIVPTSDAMVVYESGLSACDTMWRGLRLSSTGCLKTSPYTPNLWMASSSIRDAMFGIHGGTSNTIALMRDTLDANYVSLYVPQQSTTCRNSMDPNNSLIVGNEFTCSHPLKAYYSTDNRNCCDQGQSQSSLLAGTNLSAHLPTETDWRRQTLAGIWLENFRVVTIGDNDRIPNNFHDMALGIMSINSNLKLNGYRFYNIPNEQKQQSSAQYISSADKPLQGIGVASIKFPTNAFQSCLLELADNFAGPENSPGAGHYDFEHISAAAVYSRRNLSLICNNTSISDVVRGVVSSASITGSKTVEIQNCRIEANGIGIDLNGGNRYSSVNIFQNYLFIDNSTLQSLGPIAPNSYPGTPPGHSLFGIGIEVAENMGHLNAGPILNIGYNHIYLNRATFGMSMTGYSGFSVYHNVVDFNYPLGDELDDTHIHSAFYSANRNRSAFWHNHVIGTGKLRDNEFNNLSLHAPHGFYSTVTGVSDLDVFSCNTLEQTNTGMKFFGQNSSTIFKGNVFSEIDYGLHYAQGVTMPPQAVVGQQRKTVFNEWWDNEGTQDAVNDNRINNPILVILQRIFFKNNNMCDIAGSDWPCHVLPSGTNNWFVYSGNIPMYGDVDTLDKCADINLDHRLARYATAEDSSIALDTFYLADPYAAPILEASRRALYEEIVMDVDTAYSDSMFYNFLVSMTRSPIREHWRIDSLFGLLDMRIINSRIDSVDSLINATTSMLLYYDSISPKLDTFSLDSSFYKGLGLYHLQIDTLLTRFDSLEIMRAGLGDSLLANRDAILYAVNDLNSKATDTSVFEHSRKVINDIYIRTLAIGIDSFNSTDSANLHDIANLCPLEGGVAVMQARMMYNLISPEVYPDEYICFPPESYKKDQDESRLQRHDTLNDGDLITVYPNPARNRLMVRWLASNGQNAELTIEDLMGQTIVRLPLFSSDRETTIDITKLHSSTYTLQLKKQNGEIYKTKIVILK